MDLSVLVLKNYMNKSKMLRLADSYDEIEIQQRAPKILSVASDVIYVKPTFRCSLAEDIISVCENS